MIIGRIIIDFVLFLGIFLFPLWLNLLLGLICLFVFRNFYELIVFSLFADIIYGGNAGYILGIPFLLTIISLVSYTTVFFLKQRLINYN